MSGSGRKRSSKWDLKEGSRFSVEDAQYNSRPGNAYRSSHEKEPPQPGWASPQFAGNNGQRWSAKEAKDMLKYKPDLEFQSREQRRSSHKDDGVSENSFKYLKATATWDEDDSYSTRMSPGLDEWRQQNRRRSPKNDRSRVHRSRSRSRSPVHGFRRDLGVYDRSRSRSGASAQLCKDFAAGRCRKGSHCQFLHQEDQSYEDGLESRQRKDGGSKYSDPYDGREYSERSGRSAEFCSDFLKGKCRKGASCRFIHDSSDSFGGASNEAIRGRENDKRNRDGSLEQDDEREPRRNGNIPCKFFAAGNCRNGKYCRFSHGQAHLSPDRKSRGDRKLGHNSNDVEKLWNGPKWSDTNNLETSQLSRDKSGISRVSEPRLSSWSTDSKWDIDLDETRAHVEPIVSHKAVASDEKEASGWRTGNAGCSIGRSESRADENWLGDMDMSPDWNFGTHSSNLVKKEEHGHGAQSSLSLSLNGTSLPTLERDEIQETSSQIHCATEILQPRESEKSFLEQGYISKAGGALALESDYKKIAEKDYSPQIDLNISVIQNGQGFGAPPFSSLNSVGQNQVATCSDPSGGGSIRNAQTQALFREEKSISKLDIGDANMSRMSPGIPSTQNMVNSQQLSQLTNLSASLAQLLGNGKQLPQLYASLNPFNQTELSSFAKSEGMAEMGCTMNVQPSLEAGSQKQYDPLCDSIETMKDDVNDKHQGSLSDPAELKNIQDGKPASQSKDLPPSSFMDPLNVGDSHKTRSLEAEHDNDSHYLDRLEASADCKDTKETDGIVVESNKAQDSNKVVQENSTLDNIDGEVRADHGKKIKDAKGIRAFKFALAEVVKELLKPTWKEGQMSKEAYKNIVKKVVDKVIGTVQGANIPQTPEKIDQYLSFSKAKITKLVQAYVEKFQKV